MEQLTAEERQEMLRLKRFLSKNPYGGLLSDEQVLAIIRDADELVKIPSFVDEGLRKEKAQSRQNRERLKQLLRQGRLTTKEWGEMAELLDQRYPKGS
jgi:hypothetical protein